MVKSGIKINGNFLLNTQNTILSAAFILGAASGLNAVLGFVKGRLLASYFGVSEELAVFYTADRIPNLMYSVLVLGALSTIFIPIFTQMYKKDEKEAWVTASYMINSSIVFFLVLGSIVFLLAPQLMGLLSLGQFPAEQVRLGANLMRIMLGAQMILIFSSFVTCILQSFRYFLIPALSPVIYSLGMIAGIVFLSGRYGIYGPALGVTIGALLHLVIQLPLLKKVNFQFFFSLNLKDKGLREIFSLMPPRITSVLIANLSATVNNSLAILVSSASVVYLKFAHQLGFFPVSLFGVSIASAMLPTLSVENDGKDLTKFKYTLLTSLHQMLFLVIPISIILLVLRVPAVRIVYGVSNFPWEATVKTSYTLAFLSLSVFAQSSVYLLERSFYALRDTRTPVIVSAVTIFINVILSIFFIRTLGLGVWSIALSFSITSIIDMFALLYFLNKKVGGFSMERLLVPFVKISYSAVFMGISLYVPLKLLDKHVFDTTRTIELLGLTFLATIAGIVSYLFFTKIFKVEEIQLLYKLLRKLRIKASQPTAVIETNQ